MKVGSITHFFGKDVTCVDGTQDVVEMHLLYFNTVTDGTLFEVDVAHALDAVAGAPVPVPTLLYVGVESGLTDRVKRCISS